MNKFIITDGYFAGKIFFSKYAKEFIKNNPYDSRIEFRDENKILEFGGELLIGVSFIEYKDGENTNFYPKFEYLFSADNSDDKPVSIKIKSY